MNLKKSEVGQPSLQSLNCLDKTVREGFLDGFFLLMLVGWVFYFNFLFTGWDFSRVSLACKHKVCR